MRKREKTNRIILGSGRGGGTLSITHLHVDPLVLKFVQLLLKVVHVQGLLLLLFLFWKKIMVRNEMGEMRKKSKISPCHQSPHQSPPRPPPWASQPPQQRPIVRKREKEKENLKKM